MKQQELPKLVVMQIVTDHAEVICEPSSVVQEQHLFYVLTAADQLHLFRFHEVQPDGLCCQIIPSDLSSLSALKTGSQYPYLDCYWGERAALVFDRSRTWMLTTFESSPQLLIPGPSGGYLGRKWQPTDDPLPDGVEVIEDGHDHEHCRICWETISQASQPTGYSCSRKPQDDWVCVRCYEDYVAKRSLAFINS